MILLAAYIFIALFCSIALAGVGYWLADKLAG